MIGVDKTVQFCVQIKNPNPYSRVSSSELRNLYVPVRFYSIRSFQKFNYNFIRDAIWISDTLTTAAPTALTSAMPSSLTLDTKS